MDLPREFQISAEVVSAGLALGPGPAEIAAHIAQAQRGDAVEIGGGQIVAGNAHHFAYRRSNVAIGVDGGRLEQQGSGQ
ncbi:MAG: hypothetical protein DI555_11270 [Novosphingobium pentaromativorans]|uniref:Uncharacterized protein n=1 Tax=Novosphingobium pentaromativorans TaxID=205844 RepID=A0A2W5NNU3_9SPHN|nr:MAG: hypothetical protein DI555_11270 [Novosphingobium pentaromativorans]